MTRPVGVEKVSTDGLISMAVQGVLSHSLATLFWMSIVEGRTLRPTDRGGDCRSSPIHDTYSLVVGTRLRLPGRRHRSGRFVVNSDIRDVGYIRAASPVCGPLSR